MRGRAVVTNTSPTSAYRSAGRPEVMFVHRAADRHRLPPSRLRPARAAPAQPRAARRDAVPQPVGLVYDSGDYPASLRRAAELRDWAGFEARRAEARRRGRYRGIGIANSIELNTGVPRERAEMTVDPAGTVELVLGTMSAGQGHETSFAQIISEWLGVELEPGAAGHRRHRRAVAGGGSHSARSMRLGCCGDGARPRIRSSTRAARIAACAARGRRGGHRVRGAAGSS